MKSGPYFHGGAPGLHLNDLILPPRLTKAKSVFIFGGKLTRRDRVYVTDEINGARFYALLAVGGPGSVYRVEPIGLAEEDPDHLPDGSDCRAVEMARVLEVVEAQVTIWDGMLAAEAAHLTNTHGQQVPHGVRFLSTADAPSAEAA